MMKWRIERGTNDGEKGIVEEISIAGGCPLSNKKKDDEDIQATLSPTKTDRENKIQAIYDKAVKANGEALEKLSKN
ncbi:hypothetical protein ACIQZI_15680 [Peribacillus sp. NPDC096379]|uniref:hypothetical protein n=1 Tax=Peribacillus sp. NPDC096379 TaxID=3364393 RepID=UPI003821F590